MRFSTITVAATLALTSTPVLAAGNGAINDLTSLADDANTAITDIANLNVIDLPFALGKVITDINNLVADLTINPPNIGGDTTTLVSTIVNTLCTPLTTLVTTLQNAIKNIPILGPILSGVTNTLLSPLASVLQTLITFLQSLGSSVAGISDAIKCLEKIVCLIDPTASFCPVTKRDMPVARAGGATLPIQVVAF